MGDCLELFGVERCMFESNLPVDLVTISPRERWAVTLTLALALALALTLALTLTLTLTLILALTLSLTLALTRLSRRPCRGGA